MSRNTENTEPENISIGTTPKSSAGDYVFVVNGPTEVPAAEQPAKAQTVPEEKTVAEEPVKAEEKAAESASPKPEDPKEEPQEDLFAVDKKSSDSGRHWCIGSFVFGLVCILLAGGMFWCIYRGIGIWQTLKSCCKGDFSIQSDPGAWLLIQNLIHGDAAGLKDQIAALCVVIVMLALAVIGIVFVIRSFTRKCSCSAATEQEPKKDSTDKETPREAIEFQPDALEIKNSKLPLAVSLCVWTPFVVIIGAIIWASFAEVDVVVSARGKVITNQPTIVMKPYNRVVVKSVDVKVGDTVEKDQVLIVFDPEIYIADRDRLENDVETAMAQYARFQAEFFGRDYVIPSEPTKYEKEQRAIFEQRKNYFNARVSSSDSSIQYYENAEKTKLESLKSMEKQLDLLKKLCEQYESLEKNNAVSWREYTQMVISRVDMEGNITTARQSLQELRSQREAAVESKEAFIQEWQKSISEDMVATQSRLKTAQSQLKQTEQLCEYTELRAPCRAVVHELASFAEKSGVREAEPLITLIPIDDVMIEAEVRPMDIGKVQRGSSARIKLDAYPFQKYDTLNGEVIDISENTIQKDQKSLDPEASSTYYRTRLSYSGKLKGVPDSFRLIPGMEAQVEIKVGRRKVITYVLYPLIKALDTAAREP